VAYLSVYEPLEAAARHDPKVSFFAKGALLCPFLVVAGVAYVVLGKRVAAVFGTREKPSAVAWVGGVVLVLAGFGLYFWLKSVLEARGYQL
jgi:hypothetical protein